MADSSSDNMEPGGSAQKWPSAFQNDLLRPAENEITADLKLVKQELDDLVSGDTCGTSDPAPMTGFSLPDGGVDDFGSSITSDLFGVIALARETLFHQPDATFPEVCGEHSSSAPTDDSTTHYSHAATCATPGSSSLHITGENVNVFLDYGVTCPQHSLVSPSYHSAFNPHYSSISLANNASICHAAQNCSDSGSSGYSSNSPSAHSSTSESSYSASSPGTEVLPQEFNIHDYGRYPGPPGYHPAGMPQGQHLSYYGQVPGTTATGAQPTSYYMPPGTEVSEYPHNTYFIQSSPNEGRPSQFSETKHHKGRTNPTSNILAKENSDLKGAFRDSRNSSSSPTSSKVSLPTAFRNPHSNLISDPPSAFDNSSRPVFSHPHGTHYSYDPAIGSASAPLSRVGENANLKPFIRPRDPQTYFPSAIPIKPKTNVSVHIAHPPPAPLSRTLQVKFRSQIVTQSASNCTSSSALQHLNSFPSTSDSSPSTDSTGQMDQTDDVKQRFNFQGENHGGSSNVFNQKRSLPTPRVFNPGLKTTCEECGVTVASTGHLERHKGAHGADRRFRCPACDCSFSRKDNLHNHLARAHGIGQVIPRINNKRKKLNIVEGGKVW